VAGIIGVKKFAYDLWGDTVNVASRMESLGVPGKIQLPAALYPRLKDKYMLRRRGRIEVKGKGRMLVYLLEGKQEAGSRIAARRTSRPVPSITAGAGSKRMQAAQSGRPSDAMR
ncbi:MAG: adenylate/guanylate cyclase domain-containing protein, partial [Bacteroidota bacterium]